MIKEFFTHHLIPRLPRVPAPVPPGLYHYLEEKGEQATRFHLRVEPDGTGLLIANATAAARLSPAGVIIAKELLEKESQPAVLKHLRLRFKGAPASQFEADFQRVRNLLQTLSEPGDVYPVDNLEDASLSPYESQLIAPLEAAVPLCPPEIMGPILERLWAAAIPHVNLLVPTDPDPAFLLSAVARAENIGLICGVSGRATDLAQGTLLEDLTAAGVDHLTVFYASADPVVHDAYFGPGDHAAAANLFTRTEQLELADVAHIPLVHDTIRDMDATLAALQALNVPNVVFFAIATAESAAPGPIPAQAMRQVAAQVEEDAAEARVRYLWEPPVRFDPSRPLVDQVRQGPRSTGDFSIRVEPDGSVIPPRGPYQSTGNLLTNPWEAIWSHAAYRMYRAQLKAPTRCMLCPGLAICAADCPIEPRSWAS